MSLMLHIYSSIRCCSWKYSFQNAQWIVRWPICLVFIDKFCIHFGLLHLKIEWIVLNLPQLIWLIVDTYTCKADIHKWLHTIWSHAKVHINLISSKAFLPNFGRFRWHRIGLFSFWQQFKYLKKNHSSLDRFGNFNDLIFFFKKLKSNQSFINAFL